MSHYGEELDLETHLSRLGLWDERTRRIVEQISIFVARDRDRWFCSRCLKDGGYDTPDCVVPCPGGCCRSYCDACLGFDDPAKRDARFSCACGVEILQSDVFSEDA